MFKRILLSALLFTGATVASDLKAEDKPIVPAHIIQGFIKEYSPEEMAVIQQDLESLEAKYFNGMKPAKHPVYLATVGGPGASKSTILRKILKDSDGQYVFSDPDQGALIHMTHTYLAQTKGTEDLEELKAAYEKWRGASNYISNTILNKAFASGYSIAHGATSQGTPLAFYEALKKKGYRIHLVFCGSSDDNRVKAIENREVKDHIVQSAPEDTRDKADTIYRRFGDYFNVADQVDIYWTEIFSEGSTLAAVYKNKVLTIKDSDAFKRFADDYDQRQATLNAQADAKKVPDLKDVISVTNE